MQPFSAVPTLCGFLCSPFLTENRGAQQHGAMQEITGNDDTHNWRPSSAFADDAENQRAEHSLPQLCASHSPSLSLDSCLMLPLWFFNLTGVLDLLGQPDDRVHSDLRSDGRPAQTGCAGGGAPEAGSEDSFNSFAELLFCSFVLTAPNRGRARSHARQSQTRSAFHRDSQP